MNFLKTSINFVLDIFFPQMCVGCKRIIKNGVICETCFKNIRLRNGYVCPVCTGRLPLLKKTCHPQAPYILAAATDYDGTVRELISQLKYKNVQGAANPLARLIEIYARAIHFSFENKIIIPIPLHPTRKRNRGFNQAELIAQKILTLFSAPLLTDALVRIKNTEPQFHLPTRAEKKLNLQKSFSVRNTELIQKKDIILFDDITTSGATLHEAAQALKTAGARRIIALVVAKA